MDYTRVPTQLLRRMVTVISELTLTAFHLDKRRGFTLAHAEKLEKDAEELVTNMGHLMETRVNLTPTTAAQAVADVYADSAKMIYAGQPNSPERFVGKHPALGMGYGEQQEFKTDAGFPVMDTTVQDETDPVDWPWFTVWVRESDGTGTCHVSAHQCPDSDAAKEAAIEETIDDWGEEYNADNISVMGVVAGNVQVLEWDDDL